MISQTRNTIHVVRVREIDIVGVTQLIIETDMVTYLRTELEPPKIGIYTKAYLKEIINELSGNKSFPTETINVHTHASAGNQIGAVVALASSGELEINRYIKRYNDIVIVVKIALVMKSFLRTWIKENGCRICTSIIEGAFAKVQRGTET